VEPEASFEQGQTVQWPKEIKKTNRQNNDPNNSTRNNKDWAT
jgi:hypothetical protein